jgi:hypothetical protein
LTMLRGYKLSTLDQDSSQSNEVDQVDHHIVCPMYRSSFVENLLSLMPLSWFPSSSSEVQVVEHSISVHDDRSPLSSVS